MERLSFVAAWAIVAALCISEAASAGPPKLSAAGAILIDYDTGKVIYEKDADAAAPPSSQSKLLTAYYVFERIREGKISASTRFAVSEEAVAGAKKMPRDEGTTMFLEPGERVMVEDLLRALIINSGGDAALVLATNLAKSEAEFALRLNELARELGLTHTNIVNSSGAPSQNHLMSPRDLATLARRIILDYPEQYGYFGEKEFLYKPAIPGNKDNQNKLLWIMPGADGLAAGYTARGGYGLTSSAKRGNRRLIAAVSGIKGEQGSYGRFAESKALLEYGFREFSNYRYFDGGRKVLDIPVWYGTKARAGAGCAEPIMAILPAAADPEPEIIATYPSPAKAPLSKGQKLGTISLFINGALSQECDLVALEEVGKTWGFGRMWENLKQLTKKIAERK